jgi:hypothetical protein
MATVGRAEVSPVTHTAQVLHLLPVLFGHPQLSIVGGQTLLDAVMSRTSWNGSTRTTGDLKKCTSDDFWLFKEIQLTILRSLTYATAIKMLKYFNFISFNS